MSTPDSFLEKEEAVRLLWVKKYAPQEDLPSELLKSLYPNVYEFGLNGDEVHDFLATVIRRPGFLTFLSRTFEKPSMKETLKSARMEWMLALPDPIFGSLPYSAVESSLRHARELPERDKPKQAILMYVGKAIAGPGVVACSAESRWVNSLKVASMVKKFSENLDSLLDAHPLG